MKRLLVLVVALVAIGGVSPAAADAAINCSSVQIKKPVWQNAVYPNVVSVYWQAVCYDAQWRAEITLQYESGGTWHPMNCENSTPCTIYRPSSGFYPADSSNGGTVLFDPVALFCVDRMRAKLRLIGAGGTILGPYASAVSDPCS